MRSWVSTCTPAWARPRNRSCYGNAAGVSVWSQSFSTAFAHARQGKHCSGFRALDAFLWPRWVACEGLCRRRAITDRCIGMQDFVNSGDQSRLSCCCRSQRFEWVLCGSTCVACELRSKHRDECAGTVSGRGRHLEAFRLHVHVIFW